MFCRKCGKQLKDGAKFCAYCGCEVKIVSLTPEQIEEKKRAEEQRRLEEEKRRQAAEEKRRLEEEQRRIAAEELKKKKEEQKAKFKKYGIPILIAASATVVLGVAAIITVPIVKKNIADKRLHEWVSDALTKYDDKGLSQKIDVVIRDFNRYEPKELFYYDMKKTMSSSTNNIKFNDSCLDIKPIVDHHKNNHCDNMPYDSEEFNKWISLLGEPEYKTCCPFCLYAASYKGTSKARDVYEVSSRDLYKYLTIDDYIQILGFSNYKLYQVVDPVRKSIDETYSFLAETRRYSDKLDIPTMEFSKWSQLYENGPSSFRSRYDGKRIRIYGKANYAYKTTDWYGDVTGAKIDVGYTSYYSDIYPITCYFSNSSAYRTLSNYEGKTISIVGTVDVGYSFFSLDDCEVFVEETFVSPTTLQLNKCAFNIENLMLRNAGNKSAKKIGKLTKDSIVQVLQKGSADRIGGIQGNWYKVKVLSGSEVIDSSGMKYNDDQIVKGTIGWCFGGYLFDCGFDTKKVVVNGIKISE